MITDNWSKPTYGGFFPGKPYVNRGIGGQTTSQMLLRFRADVIEARPSAIVILAGTNDIAGNAGLVAVETVQGNLAGGTGARISPGLSAGTLTVSSALNLTGGSTLTFELSGATDEAASTGWISATPSSTLFRTVKSMRSPAETPCTSTTRSGDSRSIARWASTSTSTAR